MHKTASTTTQTRFHGIAFRIAAFIKKEHGALHCPFGGNRHRFSRAARRGISRLFRLQNADLLILRARRRMRLEKHSFFLRFGKENRTAF